MSKSTKWFLGILGVLALFALLSIVFFFSVLNSAFTVSGDETETVVVGGSGGKIGLVELSGVISTSEDIVRQIKKYREDRGIKAILLRIDSPGGGVVPSQEMYEEVRKTRESKPVVVSMGSLAASGGYYVACGASKIVANRGTLTGSIGVISEFLQLTDALDKLGIGMKIVKSGKLKDAGTPTRKMTPEDEAYFQELINSVYGQFVGVVETERKIEHDKVVALADGRVFTGEQAVRLGLVDTVGTYEDAIRITADMAGIHGEPSLVKERHRRSFFGSVFGDAAEAARGAVQEAIDRPVLSYKYSGPAGK